MCVAVAASATWLAAALVDRHTVDRGDALHARLLSAMTRTELMGSTRTVRDTDSDSDKDVAVDVAAAVAALDTTRMHVCRAIACGAVRGALAASECDGVLRRCARLIASRYPPTPVCLLSKLARTMSEVCRTAAEVSIPGADDTHTNKNIGDARDMGVWRALARSVGVCTRALAAATVRVRERHPHLTAVSAVENTSPCVDAPPHQDPSAMAASAAMAAIAATREKKKQTPRVKVLPFGHTHFREMATTTASALVSSSAGEADASEEEAFVFITAASDALLAVRALHATLFATNTQSVAPASAAARGKMWQKVRACACACACACD